MKNQPITDKIKRLRQRQLASGAWRVWWEPETAVKAMGFERVDLDANRPTWSVRKANDLNADVDRVRNGGTMGPQTLSDGRTMSALIHAYRQSAKYKDRAQHTRASYDYNLYVIEEKWGHRLASQFTKPVAYEWYETLTTRHGAPYALGVIRVMSILFSFAELKGWRPENSNPCFKLGMKSGRKRKRFATWQEYDQLIKSADALGMPNIACAIAMATLNSQRQLDIINAQVDGIRKTTMPDVLGHPRECLVWELVRSKRDNFGIIPLHPEVQPRVQALIDGRTTGTVLTDHATGQAYSGDLFRKRWAEVRAHAARAVPSILALGNVLQFRDLRRTFGVLARAGGASKADVGDVLGNSAGIDAGLGEVYMPPSFETAARAVFAIKRPSEP